MHTPLMQLPEIEVCPGEHMGVVEQPRHWDSQLCPIHWPFIQVWQLSHWLHLKEQEKPVHTPEKQVWQESHSPWQESRLESQGAPTQIPPMQVWHGSHVGKHSLSA